MSLQSQVFAASGTFNVPAKVSAVFIHSVGGGTGGSGYGAGTGNPQNGSGAGEFCLGRMMPVTAGGTLAIVIGAGAVGGTFSGNTAPTVDAGATTYDIYSAFGAISQHGNPANTGLGGGCNPGQAHNGNISLRLGNLESITYFGGTAGSGSSATLTVSEGAANDFAAIGPAGLLSSGTRACGGAADIWNVGGPGAPSGLDGSNATGYGAGGGTAGPVSNGNGGKGHDGAVIVFWFG